jgi:hypothetical protein
LNAVEIEQAISALAEQPFDRAEFPYAFLEAFGNKPTVLKLLRSGGKNRSDVEGAILQQKNIHLATTAPGEVGATLAHLRASPATERHKARFILATDGIEFQAEDLTSDDAPVICSYQDFPNYFGFFLPLAGISYRGQTFKSLSGIARYITGTGWSGNAFFGLNKVSKHAHQN